MQADLRLQHDFCLGERKKKIKREENETTGNEKYIYKTFYEYDFMKKIIVYF